MTDRKLKKRKDKEEVSTYPWRKLLNQSLCSTECARCCWKCQYLDECIQEWEQGVIYCKVTDDNGYCSRALIEYYKVFQNLNKKSLDRKVKEVVRRIQLKQGEHFEGWEQAELESDD